jgi:choline-sulfatase
MTKNLLIICSDEHARNAAGCYGHPVVQTPSLDALAASGTRFTNAYTPSPICIPARASLATGLHVHETGCWSSSEPYHGQHESWMHRASKAGHVCTSIGKLHFKERGGDHGFGEEILPLYLANDGKGWPEGLLRHDLHPFDSAVELATDVGRGWTDYSQYDAEIADASVNWLENQSTSDPWTLFVSFVSPHYPLKAPDEFYDLYRDYQPDLSVKPLPDHPVIQETAKFWDYERHFDDTARTEAIRGYFGLCSFMDSNVGKILDALRNTQFAEDTTILYISDHGEMLGEKGLWTKSVMYEASAGIPMILSGPDIPVGVNQTKVSLTDVSATVSHIADGVAEPAQDPWRSRSLISIAQNPDETRAVLSEYHDGGSTCGHTMLRKDQFKLIYYAGDHLSQLFDLDADPNEENDLAADPGHAMILTSLTDELFSMIDPEAINSQAFEDQRKLIDEFGGIDAILALPSFNATPIGS